MSKHERSRRDQAGVGPEPRRVGLHPMSSLHDFRIGKGEPDIRGWWVRTLNGRDIGRVADLLVDTDVGEVVMMDVSMRGSDRRIQLPLRSAQLDQRAHQVIVDSGDVDLYASDIGADGRSPTHRDQRAWLDRNGVSERPDPDGHHDIR